MTPHVGPLLASASSSVLATRSAVAALVVAATVAVLAIRHRLPRPLVKRAGPFSWAGLVAAVAVVALTGDIHSAALPALGLAIWGAVAVLGWVQAVIASLFAITAVALRAYLGGEPMVLAIPAVAATIVFTGMLPAWFAERLHRAYGREPRPVRRVETQVLALEHVEPSGRPPRPRDVDLSVDRLEASLDQEILVQLLRDVRDATGADEAIFWRWIEERNRLIPACWSTDGASRPMFFRVDDWAPLVRWSAEERQVQLDGEGDMPQFAGAPVQTDSELYGVLTVTSGVALTMRRAAAREWVPRHARQLANLLELFDVRREYGRQMRRNHNLLQAMRRLQEHSRAESLAQALCDSVMAVSGASTAVLVRWLPDEHRGLVQFAPDGLGLELGAPVAEESLVGEACRSGLKLVLEDARVATAGRSPYGGKAPRRPVPSLAVVPLLHDRRVIGAIIAEGAEPGAVTREDGQVLEILAGAVHGSLEIIWEIEEVSRRASTDPLTGLWNRRHFDEQLKRAIAQTHRFGAPCSLVLVDIDHFKQVNDTWGHEAGDAVLRQIAKVLAEGIREVDTCARYGGEEIALLLPQTPISGAVELAERLRHAVSARAVRHGSSTLTVTASFGVASYPETVAYGDGLFPAADKALYAAKSGGRNCVKVSALRQASSSTSDAAG